MRLVGSDGYFIDEDMTTLMHPRVVLSWQLNDCADPAAARRAAASHRAVPLRGAQPQGDPGDPVHRDDVRAAEAVADVTGDGDQTHPTCSFSRHSRCNALPVREVITGTRR
jgi:hypothetical protein